jgi:hypothetical protein
MPWTFDFGADEAAGIGGGDWLVLVERVAATQ